MERAALEISSRKPRDRDLLNTPTRSMPATEWIKRWPMLLLGLPLEWLAMQHWRRRHRAFNGPQWHWVASALLAHLSC